jgi:hypothetical protein
MKTITRPTTEIGNTFAMSECMRHGHGSSLEMSEGAGMSRGWGRAQAAMLEGSLDWGEEHGSSINAHCAKVRQEIVDQAAKEEAAMDLAEAVDRYTDPDDPEYDAEFDAALRRLRPDWFEEVRKWPHDDN